MSDAKRHRLVRWLRHVPPLALFAALTLWVTWPLWPAPATRMEDLGDPLLNAWILSWDHYALFHQLTAFFDANTFWPHASSLAYGEHMLTQALLALPFRLATTHPAALHNLSLMQGFFLSAVGAYLLGLHYFRRILPATVCAVAYGFAAYRVNQAPHLQLIHGEFLPLIVLAFERVLGGGAPAWRWALGLAALGQWLTSWYWAVYTFWCVVPYMAVRMWQAKRMADCGLRIAEKELHEGHQEGTKDHEEEMRYAEGGIPGTAEDLTTPPPPIQLSNAQRTTHNAQPVIPIPHFFAVVLPLLVAVAAAFPLAWPYIRLKQDRYLLRPPEAATAFIARPADFLVPMRRALVYGKFDLGARLGGIGGERALFPGFFILGGLVAAGILALIGISDFKFQISNPGSPSFPVRLWLVITLMLLSFTFGTQATVHALGGERTIPLPMALLRWFPMADQMRVPARWMLPALLGLALLAAYAWNCLASARFRGARMLAGIGFCVLVIESLTRPMAYGTVPREKPAAIDWLNRQPEPSPVLFIPPAYERVMLEAAWLRQPLVNGTNGYFPPAHPVILRDLLQAFPAPETLAALRGLGVRFVVINTAEAARPSAGWEPARLVPMLQALPASLPAKRMGDYVILDLGRPESDMQRIGLLYNQLERQAMLARKRTKGTEGTKGTQGGGL